MLIKISMKFASMGPINSISALVQMMAWHRPSNKTLSDRMMVALLMQLCVTRPQCVKNAAGLDFIFIQNFVFVLVNSCILLIHIIWSVDIVYAFLLEASFGLQVLSLSEPMMVSLPTYICVTPPQWVKALCGYLTEVLDFAEFQYFFLITFFCIVLFQIHLLMQVKSIQW